MQFSKYTLISIFIVAGLVLSVTCFSQGKTIKIKDSTGMHSYLLLRADTVLIEYDSSYLLNKRIFNLFQDNYKRVQKGSPEMKKLMENYEDLIALQDSMLKAKEFYYQQLKSNFDSLVGTTNQFVNRTDANVNSINQSLTVATGQLVIIKSALDRSLDQLKYLNRQKIKWAVGGFTVGIGAAALVFLIAK